MRRPSDSKTRLLQVAFNTIWGNSYGSVSVEQICERARVKKGSFYHFFPSKADLTVAAYEAYWENCRQQHDEIFASNIPPLQRLERYCHMIYESQKERYNHTGQVLGCPFASVGSEMSTQDEKVRRKCAELGERVCGYLERAFEDAKAAGLIPEQHCRTLAVEVHAFLVGMLSQAKIRNDVEMLANLMPAICSLARMKEPRAEPAGPAGASLPM